MDDIQRCQYTLYPLYTPFIYTLYTPFIYPLYTPFIYTLYTPFIYTLYTPLDDIRYIRVKVAEAVEEELKVMEPHY